MITKYWILFVKLKKLRIINFRNFDNCEIELSNKNLIFGMNDVGKSNLIHALRLLFDNRVRNYSIYDTDFHQLDTSKEIEISCYIDISIKNDYSEILIAKAENAIVSESELVQVKLIIHLSDDNQFITQLYWGSENEELLLIPQHGSNRTVLDDIFYCTFIPAQNNTSSTFKDFKSELLNNHTPNDEDRAIEGRIREFNKSLNSSISELSTVANMESSLNAQLELFDDNYQIKIRPNHMFGELHSNLNIFMFDKCLDDEEPKLYPTAGDGRIRKVMYAIISYLLREGKNANGRIPILLIEEPENHLFIASQIELSKTIFSESFNPFLFLVTHSPQLFFKISDEANLIRLYKKDFQIKVESEIANVGGQYNHLKNILMESLSQCLFVNRVLLVEGPSEKLLFEWVLDTLEIDRKDVVIQSINGVYFDKYLQVLVGLGIKVLMKTDNDVAKSKTKKGEAQKYTALGFNRCVDLYNIINPSSSKSKISSQATGYDELRDFVLTNHQSDILDFANLGIYLSDLDLESDLWDCLQIDDKKEFVENLYKSKWINMWKLLESLTLVEARKIYEHEKFECLKALTNE